MKNTIKTFSVLGLFLLINSFSLLNCSTNTSNEVSETSNAVKVNQAKQRPYDISENEAANMQLVEEYIAATMNLNEAKIRILLSEDYMDYGPAATDSLDLDGTIAFFREFDRLYMNQKAGIAYMTALRVNEGNLRGEWV
ncbi:MAG: hypothetical protein AAF960_21830 [Bacteroidota bacterium]